MGRKEFAGAIVEENANIVGINRTTRDIRSTVPVEIPGDSPTKVVPWNYVIPLKTAIAISQQNRIAHRHVELAIAVKIDNYDRRVGAGEIAVLKCEGSVSVAQEHFRAGPHISDQHISFAVTVQVGNGQMAARRYRCTRGLERAIPVSQQHETLRTLITLSPLRWSPK